MPTARTLALKLLRHWTVLDRPPNLPERSDPAWAALEPRERPVALDMLSGIMRHRTLLDTLIVHLARRPLLDLDPLVHAALWLGAYQLLFHDAAKPYAVVDTTVELVKQNRAPRASGLVNAVLRGLLRLEPTLVANPPGKLTAALARNAFPRTLTHHIRLNSDVFPDPRAARSAHLAVVTSHPQPLVEMLRQAAGVEPSVGILIRNNQRPSLTLRADDPAFVPLPEAGLEPHAAPGFFVAMHGWNPAIDRLVAAGTLSPQDPAAARAATALALHRAGRTTPTVLDLCAGLGTKSIQLARRFPSATVTAFDIAVDKLARLAERAQAVGVKNLAVATAATIPTQPAAILVDVPCSNTGVLGRRVQARWRWTDASVLALAITQRTILADALTRATPAAPGAQPATVVYATCSIDPRENRAIVQAVLAGHPRATLVSEDTVLPNPSPDPHAQHDGAYVALIDIT